MSQLHRPLQLALGPGRQELETYLASHVQVDIEVTVPPPTMGPINALWSWKQLQLLHSFPGKLGVLLSLRLGALPSYTSIPTSDLPQASRPCASATPLGRLPSSSPLSPSSKDLWHTAHPAAVLSVHSPLCPSLPRSAPGDQSLTSILLGLLKIFKMH